MNDTWLDPFNAQMYEAYAQKYPFYRELGKKLVEVADIQQGMTIVDLACGTGIVTAQILTKLNSTSTVIGVDGSPAMLDIARQKFRNAVSLLQSSAENLHAVLPAASVDILVCNSAFWQMRVQETLDGISNVLKPGGNFVFDLPDFEVYSSQTLRDRFSYQFTQLMIQIAQTEFGYIPKQRSRRPGYGPVTRSLEEIRASLATSSLTLISHDQTINVERTAQDLYEFQKIPVMSLRFLPGLNYATRIQIVETAYQRLNAKHSDTATWRYYVAEKE
jgi:ubiquinone/menaquinone biosynthesis C-methylase UbiE